MLDDVVERLCALVADDLDVNLRREDINPDVPLLEGGLGLDSLAIIDLVSATEASFGIEFSEDELVMETFANLRALAGVVQLLTARAAEAAHAV